MTRSQLLLQALKSGPLCAAEIAESSGISIDDVRASMSGLVGDGRVSVTKKLGPSGRRCSFWSLAAVRLERERPSRGYDHRALCEALGYPAK